MQFWEEYLYRIFGTRSERLCQIRLSSSRHGRQTLWIAVFLSSPCCDAVCRKHRLEGSAAILKYSMEPSWDFTGHCPRDQLLVLQVKYKRLEEIYNILIILVFELPFCKLQENVTYLKQPHPSRYFPLKIKLLSVPDQCLFNSSVRNASTMNCITGMQFTLVVLP